MGEFRHLSLPGGYIHHSNIIHVSIFVAILPEDAPTGFAKSLLQRMKPAGFSNDESGRAYPSVDLIIAMETKNPSLSSGNSHFVEMV